MVWTGAIATLALLGQVGPPIDPQTAALLDKMSKAYKAIHSAKVTSSYSETKNALSVSIKSESTFLAPASFRIVSTGLPTLSGSGYTLVTDGKLIRTDGLPSKPWTSKYSRRDMVLNLPQVNLEVLCLWDWNRQLSYQRGGGMFRSTFKISSERRDGKSFTVLEETARRSQVRVRYFVDPSTFLISRTEVFDLTTNATPFQIYQIEKMELGVPVDAKQFVVPPAAAPKAKG